MIDHRERPLRPLYALTLAAMTAAFIGLAGCEDVEDGDTGPQGEVGPAGPAGPAGADGADGTDGADGADGADGEDGVTGYTVPGLTRLATLPLGSEATGLFLKDGNLFFNVQHPDDTNDTRMTDGAGTEQTFAKGTVGVVTGVDSLPAGFAGVDVPRTDAEKEVVRTALGQYQVLLQQGDDLDDGTQAGDILNKAGDTTLKNSNDPDFNGVVSNGNGGYYVFTNWEDRPGSMSRIEISENGLQWNVTKEGMLDFSSVEGTWVNCFGTVSPWGTPLSAEELYFDNTADWYNEDYSYFGNPQAVAEYLGYDSDPASATDWPNPYRYGYNVEITDPDAADEDDVAPNKREALGRFSHENAVVMPDEKTVYQSDDGTGTVFFKFVADTAGDLSQGTLYAAEATQDSGTNDPATTGFDIQWIELASGKESDIEADIAKFDDVEFGDAVHFTDEHIQGYAEEKAGSDLDGDGTTESFDGLDLNGDGDVTDAGDIAADSNVVAFVETRKVAAAMGATNEFRKMEGVNISVARAEDAVGGGSNGTGATEAYAYMAMSNVNKTMADGEGDIQLNGRSGDCGAVYRMKLGANYNIDRMEPAVVGGPYNGDRAVNTCNVNNISEPDNLLVMDDGRVIIGEDTGEHENNMVWVYDPSRN